jgi:hypothetical protein
MAVKTDSYFGEVAQTLEDTGTIIGVEERVLTNHKG